jgi:SAM-dependent methyltransferase
VADNSHNLGTDGFANGERYDSVRPDYPRSAVAYLVDALGIDSDAHVVDLGAGTGIFTNQLVPFGPRITAVEPTSGMREILAKRLPSVTVLEGRDVAIPLESSSVDCVIAAQAFHWFDAPLALEEIHRVLVDGGRLGLVWNIRDESVPWVADLGRAMRWPEFQPYEVGKDFTPIVAAGPFVNVERKKFSHRQRLTHDELMRRVLSTSFIAVMDDEKQTLLMDEVANVIRHLPDPVDLPYVTDVYRATAALR